MAFHVACPITCKRICYCTLGLPAILRSDNSTDRIPQLHHLLVDPSFLRVSTPTVQVPVPKLSTYSGADSDPGDADDEEDQFLPLQRMAAVASLAADDLAMRLHSPAPFQASPSDVDGEEQDLSTVSTMCRLCFSSEIEGTGREKKMLSCRTCSKKYHRSCLKTWAQNRDLFHWSSWTCPSCRVCEVCSSTGDPKKFNFCRRCDAAYHCYCMQPPLKNVNSGPYLCPNHTRCHSCNSNVPGNGLSVRWHLGYSCCDACGRLFTKGNFCPVCLRVYRDSESIPMVCCDICQRWVHCECDNISDEEYTRFQADGNLPYTCSTCRGECYQVKDLQDAVHELWKRRDEADRDLIATLRAAAGLPTKEEIFAISPFSDDEDCGPPGVKNEYRRAELSLKGLAEISPKKTKNFGEKSSKKKKKGYKMALNGKIGPNPKFEGYQDDVSMVYAPTPVGDALQSHKRQQFPCPAEGICRSINQRRDLKQKNVDETGDNEKRYGVIQIKSKTTKNTPSSDDVSMGASKKAIKATKLVIHLGGRNRNSPNSPKSDTSSYLREHELAVLNGGEAVSWHKDGKKFIVERSDIAANHDEGGRFDNVCGTRGVKYRETERTAIRLGKGKKGRSSGIDQGNEAGVNEVFSTENTPILLTKRRGGSMIEAGDITYSRKHPETPVPLMKKRGGCTTEPGDITYSRKHPETPILLTKWRGGSTTEAGDITYSRKHPGSRPGEPPSLHATPKDSKCMWKIKIKPPFQDSWISHGEDETGVPVKGQRSKRKRPSQKPISEEDDEDTESLQDSVMNDIMDANWILKKLGKDAIGKRVEVQQLSDNSWHKGVVSNLVKATSMLSVDLDDGSTKTVELGKQGIRFVAQKKRETKTVKRRPS